MAAQAAQNRLLKTQSGFKPIIKTRNDGIHVYVRIDNFSQAERYAKQVDHFKAREAHETFENDAVMYVIIDEDNAIDVLDSFADSEILEVVERGE